MLGATTDGIIPYDRNNGEPCSNRRLKTSSWAAPKGANGTIDHNTALTGDDLIAFVNAKLFPYLQGFKAKAPGPNTIEYKIGEIFGEIKNRIQSGYNLLEECNLHTVLDILEATFQVELRTLSRGGELQTSICDKIIDVG